MKVLNFLNNLYLYVNSIPKMVFLYAYKKYDPHFFTLNWKNILCRSEEVVEARMDYTKQLWEPTLEKKKKQ